MGPHKKRSTPRDENLKMPVSAPKGLVSSDPIKWPSRRVTSVPTRRRLSTSELFAIGTGPSANNDPGELIVGDLPVAVVASEGARINPMRTTSAQGMPAVEMLAAMAATDPTGVLALESADGKRGFAFEVVAGRVTGAQGTGEYGQLERWSAGIHARFPERFKAGDRGMPLWVQLAKTFVSTRFLEALMHAEEVGTQMTFVRGEVQWIGTRLPTEHGIRLGHLLLEYARVNDEMPQLEQRLGPTTQLVVPISHPAPEPPAKATDNEADGWGALNSAPEDDEEWKDARAVWSLCDGVMSIEELLAAAMLGRFRTMSAVLRLRDAGHVVLGDAPDRIVRDTAPVAPVLPFVGPSSRSQAPARSKPSSREATAPSQTAGPQTIVVDPRVLGALAVRPAMVRQTIETFIGACPDWMAELETGLRNEQIDAVRRAGGRISGAARAVGAGLMGSFAAMIVALADDGDFETALGMIDELEHRYGQSFRQLMELHASLD